MHPWGTSDTPAFMPHVQVVFDGAWASVQQMTGITTATGAVIPATAPGQFGQVAIAGGGRH